MEDKKLQEQAEDQAAELVDQQLEDASGGYPPFNPRFGNLPLRELVDEDKPDASPKGLRPGKRTFL